jgi:curved DNA-binding protein CbpA
VLFRYFRREESKKSGIKQFIHLVATVIDTPTLIQRIAEDRHYLQYCAAIVKPEDQKDAFLRHLDQELKKASYQQQFPYERLQEKLSPVGIALGLKGRTTDSIQSDYYHILGTTTSATDHEIKSAYRKKAMESHPDTATGEKEQFIRIQEAFKVLSDKVLRRQYDLSRNSMGSWNWSENTRIPASKKKSFLQRHRVEVSFVAFILILAGVSFVADSINQHYSLMEDIVPVENRADTSVDRDTSGQEGSTKIQSSMVAKQEKIETLNVPKIDQNKVTRIADQSKKQPQSINQKTISKKAEKKKLLAAKTETKQEPAIAKTGISKSKQPQKEPKQLITEKKKLLAAKTETKQEPAIIKTGISKSKQPQKEPKQLITEKKKLLAARTDAKQEPAIAKTAVSKSKQPQKEPKQLITEKKKLLAAKTETKQEPAIIKTGISKSKQPQKEPKQLITEKKKLLAAKTETKQEPEQVAVSRAVPAKEVNDKPEKQTVSKIDRVSKGLSAQLANFLQIYCQTYEGKDLERITGFFADNARENGQSFQELIPKYRRNFDVVDEINYRIDMANYLWDIDENKVKINGEFFLSWRKNEERGLYQYHGDISMKLIFHDNSFLIEDLSYRFDR